MTIKSKIKFAALNEEKKEMVKNYCLRKLKLASKRLATIIDDGISLNGGSFDYLEENLIKEINLIADVMRSIDCDILVEKSLYKLYEFFHIKPEKCSELIRLMKQIK